MLDAMLPPLLPLLLGREIGAEVRHQLGPHARPRHVEDAQRAQDQTLLYRYRFTGVNIASRLCRQLVHGDAPGATCVTRETSTFEDAYGPEPFVQTGGGIDSSDAQCEKGKTAASVVKHAAVGFSGVFEAIPRLTFSYPREFGAKPVVHERFLMADRVIAETHGDLH